MTIEKERLSQEKAEISDRISEGLLCWRENNIKKACKNFEEAAEMGDAQGLFYTGLCYAALENPSAAFKYFNLAADQHYIPAFTALGHCYKAGLGISPSEKDALNWYERAAQEGDSNDLLVVGLFYLNSNSFEDQRESSIRYLKLAADKNNLEAQFELSLCYLKDDQFDIGRKYLQMAADGGYARAQYFLALCLQWGNLEISQDKNQALNYMQLSADSQYIEALREAGIWLWLKGTTESLEKAKEYWKKGMALDPICCYGFIVSHLLMESINSNNAETTECFTGLEEAQKKFDRFEKKDRFSKSLGNILEVIWKKKKQEKMVIPPIINDEIKSILKDGFQTFLNERNMDFKEHNWKKIEKNK